MKPLARIAAIGLVAACVQIQSASAHELSWRFNAIYSNASGTVQFIELFNAHDNEHTVSAHTLESAGNTFTFPTDLPAGTPTAGRSLLLATPGYFALRGVPQADYNLGVNQFFNVAGDTLDFAHVDTLTFSSGQLPADNRTALARVAPTTGAELTPEVNSPTNFFDATGAIPPWENQNNRLDVTNDGNVFPEDVVRIINELLVNQAHDLATPSGENSPPPFFDVSGNNKVQPQDALQVINHLLQSQGIQPAGPLVHVEIVPEPSAAALALAGAALVGFFVRKGHARRYPARAGTGRVVRSSV